MRKFFIKSTIATITLIVALIPLVKVEALNILDVASENMQDYRVSFYANSAQTVEDFYVVYSFYKGSAYIKSILKTVESFTGEVKLDQQYDDDYTKVMVYFIYQSNLAPIRSPIEIVDYEKAKYKVDFIDFDGTIIDSQVVKHGEAAQIPRKPSRDDYIFEKWDRDTSEVTEDMDVNAVYTTSIEDNLFVISDGVAEVGQEIVVTLELKGDVKVCAFEMGLHYNPDDLEFISLNDQVGTFDVVANHIGETNTILLNFVSLLNKTEGSDLLEMHFLVKQTDVSYTFLEFFNSDSFSIAYTDESYNLYQAAYHCVYGEVEIQ